MQSHDAEFSDHGRTPIPRHVQNALNQGSRPQPIATPVNSVSNPTDAMLDAKWRDLIANGNDAAVCAYAEYERAMESARTCLGELRDLARMKLSDEKPSWESSGPTLSEVGDRKNFPRNVASDECENGCGFEMKNCICDK